jgi:HD-GYP domain-containing protein (c-di-GMP phosphodiesterase class II)
MMTGKPRPILAADPDASFLAGLKADPKAASLPPVTVANGKDAQLLLADSNQPFSALYINLALEGPSGLAVVRFAHQRRPALPIYVIHDGKLPVDEKDLKQLPVHKVLPKPISYSDMVKYVMPASVFFDANKAIEEAKKSGDKLDAEIAAEDAAFLPIRSEDFLSGARSFFDVYVRLAAGKFVKILQAGDTFTPDRITNYIKKGVRYFYLRKEAQEQYLSYVDRLATAVLGSEKVSGKVQVSQTLNHGEETMSFLRNQGLSEANLQYAGSFVGNLNSLVQKMDPAKNDMLRGFIADVAAYDHGVGVAAIASLLNAAMKIESDRAVQIVGLASLLHDIGLQRMPDECKAEDESKMNPEQIGIYRTHPTIGAKILQEIHGIAPAVIQAVQQHHERRDKSGFPARSGAGMINRVAEMVGIADEFVLLIHRMKENPKLNVVQQMETHIFEKFSKQIVENFRAVFFSRKK